MPRQDGYFLQVLATRTGTSIGTHRLRAAERDSLGAALRARRALDAMALTLRLGFHRDLANRVMAIQMDLDELKDSGLSQAQGPILARLYATLAKLGHLVEKARGAGARVATMERALARVDKLLNQALSKYSALADTAGVKVNCTAPEVNARVDAVLILEAFENVIENAIKAMSESPERRLGLAVRCDPGAKAFEVLVTDTGKGMTVEEIELVTAGKWPDARPIAGGLGLMLTRLCCESHGGSLEIDSSPGAGTTVKMIIPLTEVGSLP